MIFGYMMLALFSGMMLPMQSAVNARLERVAGSPVWAAAISGVVLTVILIVVATAVTRAGPRTVGLAHLPWWAWLGGLCGAVLLAATVTTVPRLGAASMMALVIAGQVACSLALDQWGLFGLASHPATGKRLVAAALLFGGAALMR